jgi:hypothetical protein
MNRMRLYTLRLKIWYVALTLAILRTASAHAGDEAGPVLSQAAVGIESKTSYSSTTWISVLRYRIITPGVIQTSADGNSWTLFQPPPSGQKPVAIAAARTTEQAADSKTTSIRVHVYLLTHTGDIWRSEDAGRWTLAVRSDGTPAIGIAAAAYPEKPSSSRARYSTVRLFRLLKDGTIESYDTGDWVLYADGTPGTKAISATAAREKTRYSNTTGWSVVLFRLLGNGEVEKRVDGEWRVHANHPNAASIAAYTVEEKASYRSRTWEDVRLEAVSSTAADAKLKSASKMTSQQTTTQPSLRDEMSSVVPPPVLPPPVLPPSLSSYSIPPAPKSPAEREVTKGELPTDLPASRSNAKPEATNDVPRTPPVAVASPTVSAQPREPVRAPAPVSLGLNVEPRSSPPVVAVVVSNTPAANAGVRAGDVVVAIDGSSVASAQDISRILSSKHPGDVLRIELRRGQQRVTAKPRLVATPGLFPIY